LAQADQAPVNIRSRLCWVSLPRGGPFCWMIPAWRSICLRPFLKICVALPIFVLGNNDARAAQRNHSERCTESRSLVSFGEFAAKHGRDYRPDTKEYDMRQSIFERRVREIELHNCQGGQLWKAGLNDLADRTDDELDALHNRRNGIGLDAHAHGSRALREVTEDFGSEPLPDNVSWAHLKAAQKENIVDQSVYCGGACWAVSTTTALRLHSEIYQQYRTFSVQQLLSCTPNPEQCGGKGGRTGATGELALDYIAHNGLATEEEFPNSHFDSACPASMQPKHPDPRPYPVRGTAEGPGTSFGMLGWSKLPVYEAEFLRRALYERGPVVVPVATEGWMAYESGIMHTCPKAAVLNHEVVLIAYGMSDSYKIWQIQNSWGPSWGENGHMRLLRHDDDDNTQCGEDLYPGQGPGCSGGPKSMRVCGMCGILSDGVVPHFTGDSKSAMSMAARRGATTPVLT